MSEIDKIRQEWEGIEASEKLGGNIVKEAEARGVLLGLRILEATSFCSNVAGDEVDPFGDLVN